MLLLEQKQIGVCLFITLKNEGGSYHKFMSLTW
jgi:hypothetical protein